MIITSDTRAGHIEILKNAKESGSLALFVGSGVSSATSKDYKSWGCIIDELKNTLNCPNESDFLKIAQLYSLEYGKIQFKKKVKSYFPQNDVPGKLQEAIVNLRPHYIVTTNWDNLIDNAIDNNPGFIDKVVSDKELVQSDNDNKYIKMHGDFLHDNFVFTEDDYLNYSYNFPLIENFVKSILSTHIVLLLGYSFSDWDLKQIVAWLRNNSKERPAIYMFAEETFPSVKAKYYDNLGINILPSYKYDYSNYEEEFLKLIQQIQGDKHTSILSSPEGYILSVLKPFEKYPVLLRDGVKKALTNCSVIYDAYSRAILEFDLKLERKDRNENILEKYKEFYEGINTYIETKNSDYFKIVEILKKADIHGIYTDDSYFNKEKYYSFDDEQDTVYLSYNKEIDFNFSGDLSSTFSKKLEELFDLYNSEEYVKAYLLVKEIIAESRKVQNYAVALIGLFNFNSILHKLKYSFQISPEVSKLYREIDFVDLEKEFYGLPEKYKKGLRPIYDFLSFSTIYKESFFSAKDLDDIRKHKRIIAEGGISFCSELPGHKAKLKNLVDFVLNNYICIEEYTEFRSLCQTYLLMEIENNFENDIPVGKIELYTSIKYFSHKELKEFYVDFYKKNPPEKVFKISENDKNWLLNTVFKNIVSIFIQKTYPFSGLGEYCQNCLFLLSIIELSKEQTEEVFVILNELVSNARNSLGIFENLNSFIGLQHNIFNNKDLNGKQILSILETLLLKFVDGKISGNEELALTQSKITNIFALSKITETYFNNSELLNRVLDSVKETEIKNQVLWIQRVILPIYEVSDSDCKLIIKEYISSDKLSQAETSGDHETVINYLILKILFHLAEIVPLDESFNELVKKSLNSYPENTFSCSFGWLQDLTANLSKKNSEFDELSKFVNAFVENRKKILPFGDIK